MYVPPPLYLLFEIPAYLLTLIVLWTAFRESRYLGLVLVAAMGCGFFIEWFDVRTTETYFYNRFVLMVASYPDWVPLSICTVWACILYSVTHTTDALPLPWWQRPAVDALLAVNIDFVLDPVVAASRIVPHVKPLCDTPGFAAGPADGIGFWVWCVTSPQGLSWFGIPIGNFYGWIAVIFSLSLAWRCISRWLKPTARSLPYQLFAVLLTAVAGIASTYLLLGLYILLFQGLHVPQAILIGVALGIPILFLARAWPSIVRDRPPNWVALGMPALSGLFCLAAFFAGGIYKKAGWDLLLAIVGLTILGVYLFSLPYKRPGSSNP